MARITFEDGSATTDLARIGEALAPLGVRLDTWPLGDDPAVRDLLGRDQLDGEEKEQVLTALDHYFAELQRDAGYQSRDLIVLHPGIEGLDGLLQKFDRCHTHDDDEVRYIVAGEGVFGFVRPDGSQVALTVQQAEYINVPAGTEHWFVLTPARRIKAVRYFTTTEGWTPNYTGTTVRAAAAP